MPKRFLLAGVLGIFCGESFCILGPLRYERRIHVACHSILCSGTLLPSSTPSVLSKLKCPVFVANEMSAFVNLP
jgi:hypothetical protein